MGGLIFTGILLVWQINGALIMGEKKTALSLRSTQALKGNRPAMHQIPLTHNLNPPAGILFTSFISWILFPDKIQDGGLVPNSFAAVPSLATTGFALDFNWGDNTGRLIGAVFTFLYLDFLGSAITFAAMGQMCGMVNEKGDIPNRCAAPPRSLRPAKL